MPSLAAVRAVNASVLANASPTAVVIGGTSGIGENIALALASMCKAPHVLISGRKRVGVAADPCSLAELYTIHCGVPLRVCIVSHVYQASAERVLQTMHQVLKATCLLHAGR